MPAKPFCVELGLTAIGLPADGTGDTESGEDSQGRRDPSRQYPGTLASVSPSTLFIRRSPIEASLLLLGLCLIDSGNGLVDSLCGLPPDLSGEHKAWPKGGHHPCEGVFDSADIAGDVDGDPQAPYERLGGFRGARAQDVSGETVIRRYRIPRLWREARLGCLLRFGAVFTFVTSMGSRSMSQGRESCGLRTR